MDFKAMVSRIKYKPGWTFSVETLSWHGGDPDSTLSITASVYDSRNLDDRVEFTMRRIIPEFIVDQNTFLSWFKSVLKEAEFHELREFFRFDGELVDDPHAVRPLHFNEPLRGLT